MSTLSNNLKRFRIARNLTQEQAAEELNVSSQTVSRWECNTTLPDVVILPRLAELYGVTIDDLFKESNSAYDNNAQRLGSVFEASLKPEDFLRADMEYRNLLKSGDYTTKDLRLYGILHQQMMYLCIKKAEELFDCVMPTDRVMIRRPTGQFGGKKNIFYGKSDAIRKALMNFFRLWKKAAANCRSGFV